MRKSMRFLPALGLVVTFATGAGSSAFAVPITYTESARASGSLGHVAFTNEPVVLTMHNDTANVTGGTPPAPFINAGTITLRVDALSPVPFTDPDLHIFANEVTHLVGFTDETTGNDILDLTNVAFATYDLRTAIGPVTGTPSFIANLPFPTTAGDFILTSVGPATFTARLPTTVPEPASLALMGTGLAGLALILRRRKQAV